LDLFDFSQIKCVVFDFGNTLSSEYYFNISPPGCPQWFEFIQEHIFGQPSITNPWMKGDLTSLDIAGMLTKYFPLGVETILEIMEAGCRNLHFNPAVRSFAAAQRSAQRKTALVTANMDIFSKVVVPAHKLDQLFDVILNTSDFHELRKEKLWPAAFERLGGQIGFGNSLLIEDGENEPAKFRALGGRAYQYSNDTAFLEWLGTLSAGDSSRARPSSSWPAKAGRS
jgi:FMN phosphatase YigB (HAD superfamily)